MRGTRDLTRALAIVVSLVPACVFLVAWLAGAPVTHRFVDPDLHFVVVSSGSVVCSLVSGLMSAESLRRRDMRSGLVAGGFTLMAGLLAVHGLATPGFLLGADEVYATVGVAGALAVPVGGVLLAVAVAVPPAQRRARVLVGAVQGASVLVVGAFGAIGILRPGWMPFLPVAFEPWMYALLVATTVLYAWASRRALASYLLTRRGADLAVTFGLAWLGMSLWLYLLSPLWSATFWSGHALELAGFLAVAGGVGVDLRRQSPSRQLEREVRPTDLAAEEALLGGYVRALMSDLERRDPSTGAHSRRVARLAVEIAEELGLPAPALRRVAIAGLVHDIGKLRVPKEILNKAGRLTDEEFAQVKLHPVRGAETLAHLGGLDDVVPIVLAHHERFAGGGYPHDTAGAAIPLEARIITVCDVYDALTSTRAYRPAWPAGRAVELLLDERGTAFDPVCVDALLRVLGVSDAAELPRAA